MIQEEKLIMNIQGFQKLTLLDFPGKMACTVFTAGCNLRCPFCHNSRLVIDPEKTSEYSVDEILAYLKKRQGILDGVAITGGEPLLQPDIDEFIKKVRELGFAVKLDTNGTFPDRLKALVEQGLLDYVAMDVKNSPSGYSETVGIGGYDISKIQESIGFLLENKVDYEFRTTVVREFHSVFEIDGIGKMIKGAKRHYLQAFVDSGELIGFDLSAVPKEEMLEMQKIMLKYVDFCEIRGV
ncbi:MAG: anaerobic ribonucleoside-triphosphate reductase activating protein [Oscillospiraceae bacterium]|nr:anaerobic ribonucleoside-triphosphate reductase activating protein [Oscillospiraceae bacterium]